MEWLFSKAARTLLHMSNRLPHSSPLFQKRTFQSISSLHADLTIATPQTDSPARSYPRSEAGSLLGLDTPESSNSRTARHIAASAASKARAVAKEPSSAKKAIILKDNRDLEGLMYRKWQAGDVYTPHDLTPREIREYKTAKSPSRDIFDSLGINPLDYYKNPVLLAEFMTPGGKIKHSKETGLRPVNQRKIAKAIRRAIGMGLMPKCHVHPEMLRRRGPDARTRRYQWQ